jgi:hypothetical protein
MTVYEHYYLGEGIHITLPKGDIEAWNKMKKIMDIILKEKPEE